MKKNTILFVIALVSALVFSQSNSSRKVVLMNMNNFDHVTLGCEDGSSRYLSGRGDATLRIDKLASEGSGLSNYSEEAKCRPSRAALMAGRKGN